MAKKQKTRVRIPAGKLHYPYLLNPDTRFTDSRKPNGDYKTGVILDPNEDSTKELIAKLNQVRDDYREERIANESDPRKKKALEKYTVKECFTEQIDDKGNETGMIIVKASQAKTIVAKSGTEHTFSVTVVDAKRQPFPKNTSIYGGTVAKVVVDASGYDMGTDKSFGVSLQLVAVQVIDLVSGSGADANDLFDEEDGYTAPAVTAGVSADEFEGDDEDF